MKLKLPSINAGALSRDFVRRQALRRVANIIEEIGPKNLDWMIKKNKTLEDFISPEQTSVLLGEAKKYYWLADIITAEDLIKSLPDWALVVIKANGENGKIWMQRQIGQLEKAFKGEYLAG